jgi:hypothetical protein
MGVFERSKTSKRTKTPCAICLLKYMRSRFRRFFHHTYIMII